jgi:hypothetical protein
MRGTIGHLWIPGSDVPYFGGVSESRWVQRSLWDLCTVEGVSWGYSCAIITTATYSVYVLARPWRPSTMTETDIASQDHLHTLLGRSVICGPSWHASETSQFLKRINCGKGVLVGEHLYYTVRIESLRIRTIVLPSWAGIRLST